MDKKFIYIGVAIVVLLVLAGGAFMLTRNSPSAPQTGNEIQSTVTPAATENPSSQTSLKDLLLSGSSQKCTYQDKSDSIDISGTSYITAGKVRSDYQTTAAGKVTAGHMIMDGKTSYIWMDGQTTGFKMTFDVNETVSTQAAGQQSVDVSKVLDYNCSAWTTDNSLFTPPTTLKFTDFSSMMPKTDNKCSVCDSLPADSKAQCLQALKCS